MSMVVWLLVGCGSDWEIQDNDGDGYTWLQGDCDDDNALIYPSARETR